MDSTIHATFGDDRPHRNGVTVRNHLRCCARGQVPSLQVRSSARCLLHSKSGIPNHCPVRALRSMVVQPWTRVFQLSSLRWQGEILERCKGRSWFSLAGRESICPAQGSQEMEKFTTPIPFPPPSLWRTTSLRASMDHQQNKNQQIASFLHLKSGQSLWIQYSFKSFTKSARELNLPIEEFPFVQMVSFGRSLWCWQHRRGHIRAQMDCSSSVSLL